jgi:hypothetical protein
MTPDLGEVLRQIAADKASCGYRMQPPCRQEEIDILRHALASSLRIDIPAGYEDLLRVTNGIDFNGTLIFAARNTPHVNLPGTVIEGLMEANDIRRENASQFLIFGESGMEMYAQNLESGGWEVVDQVSLDVCERFATFDDLAASVLRKRLT